MDLPATHERGMEIAFQEGWGGGAWSTTRVRTEADAGAIGLPLQRAVRFRTRTLGEAGLQ